MKDLASLSDDELFAAAGVAPPQLVASVMHEESRGNPNAVSPKGAKGRMQVMDDTNRDPGFGVRPARDNSQAERERVGTEYLGKMFAKYGGDPYLTAAAYNAGPGRVDKVKGDISKLPPETRAYAPKVVAGMDKNDLSKMSNEELAAAAGVDLSQMSDADLMAAAGVQPPQAPAAPAAPQAPFMARVGRGAMDKAQGIKQAYMKLQADLGIIDPDLPRQYTEDVNKELASYGKSAPQGMDLARILGGAAAEAPLMAAGGVPGALAGGFVSGATNFVPSGKDEDRMFNALVGAGVGGGFAGLAPATRAIFGNKATETMKANVELARKLGINPRPSQFTNNAVAQRFEMMLDTMPGGHAAFKGLDQKNVQALNNSVLKIFGKEGTEITTEMADDIGNQINGLYSTALGGTPLKWDRPFVLELNRLSGEIKKLPKAMQSNEALSLVNDPRFRKTMDADTYNQIRSELGRQAKNAFANKNSTLGDTMEKVQAAMDDWATRQLPTPQAAALQEARSQYRSWTVVDKALDSTTGNVSPAKLANEARKNDPLGFKRGVNPREVTTVGRAASTIAKTPPDSGTAARMGMGWRGLPLAGLAGGSALGGPAGMLTGLAVAIPGAYGAGRAYLSPAAQAAARMMEEQTSMLAPRVAPFLGGAVTQPE